MAWYRVTEKATGEAQHVQARNRRQLDTHYPAKLYKRRTLAREPHEADVFEGGKLKRCQRAAERIALGAELHQLPRVELVELVVREVMARLVRAGIMDAKIAEEVAQWTISPTSPSLSAASAPTPSGEPLPPT